MHSRLLPLDVNYQLLHLVSRGAAQRKQSEINDRGNIAPLSHRRSDKYELFDAHSINSMSARRACSSTSLPTWIDARSLKYVHLERSALTVRSDSHCIAGWLSTRHLYRIMHEPHRPDGNRTVRLVRQRTDCRRKRAWSSHSERGRPATREFMRRHSKRHSDMMMSHSVTCLTYWAC